MTKFVLLLFVLFGSHLSFGQTRLIGELERQDFVKIQHISEYGFMDKNSESTIEESKTILGDTSGIVFNDEYVLFRNYNSYYLKSANIQFIKSTPVTVAEYQEFQRWVKDSMARELLYDRIPDDQEALRFLNYTDIYFDDGKLEYAEFDPANRYDNRIYFPLNRKTKFEYTDADFLPILHDMYLPLAERFYQRKDFDERKLLYEYYEIDIVGASIQSKSTNSSKQNHLSGHEQRTRYIVDQTIPVISDTYTWSKESFSVNDERSVLGQAYNLLLSNQPVIGLTGMQARAFCHWKQERLQKEFGEFPGLTVYVTLPKSEDLSYVGNNQKSLEIAAHNYTEQWKITVEAYQDFMRSVQDSIAMEALYYRINNLDDAAKFLNHPKAHFSELSLEYMEFDPDEVEYNRSTFPFVVNKSILKRYPSLYDSIKSTSTYSNPEYKYYWIDANFASQEGVLKAGKDSRVLNVTTFDTIRRSAIGKEVGLGRINRYGYSSGVRGFIGYNKLIKYKIIPLSPQIPLETQNKNDLIKGITYEQALAFYHWKYPLWKAKVGEDWQEYVYPTETQFNQVQNGETLVVPAHQSDYPTPTFRYVVHIVSRSE